MPNFRGTGPKVCLFLSLIAANGAANLWYIVKSTQFCEFLEQSFQYQRNISDTMSKILFLSIIFMLKIPTATDKPTMIKIITIRRFCDDGQNITYWSWSGHITVDQLCPVGTISGARSQDKFIYTLRHIKYKTLLVTWFDLSKSSAKFRYHVIL